MATPNQTLTQRAVDIAWRQWTSLGVAGVELQQSGSVIDPEALIVLTARLGDADPRLRDESTDWCVRYGARLVSTSRLRNLVRMPAPTCSLLDEYFTTVNEHSRTRWPTTRVVAPRAVTLSGKSKMPSPEKRPALLRLQLRALFGVTARAEVLAAFLSSNTGSERSFTASELTCTGYSKRNIAFVLDDLAMCGLVTSRRDGNRAIFRLHKRASLTKLAPAANNAQLVRWDVRLRVLAALRHVALDTEAKSAVVRSVEANKCMDAMAADVGALDLTPPVPVHPESYLDELVTWVSDELVGPDLR